MSKILLVNTSPRKGGNSDAALQTIADELGGNEVIEFAMRDKDCRFCLACGACQNKETPQPCVLPDDITSLQQTIDGCDAIVMASPIYNHQVCSRARLFIERFYPFFKFDAPGMTNTTKHCKKAALICVCWGSPIDKTREYAEWTAQAFSQIGADNIRSLVFNGIPERGQVLEHPEYLEQLYELAAWLVE